MLGRDRRRRATPGPQPEVPQRPTDMREPESKPSPSSAAPRARPPVSVVMPFAGDEDAARHALDALRTIERRPGDELIVADNSDGVIRRLAHDRPEIRVIAAPQQRSSYYARNVAAADASNEWVLFLDSDCVPSPHILDLYFGEPVSEQEGAIAGEILAEDAHGSAIARYQADRRYLSQHRNVNDPRRAYAVTANLLVRTQAWRAVGGFLEGIRSGGDTEFTWRLQDAGWKLGYRPEASAMHRHRGSTRSFARMILRYEAGRAWLGRRYPDVLAPSPQSWEGLRALVAAAHWTLRGDPERARFRAIDALVIALNRLGPLFANASQQPPRERVSSQLVVLCDTFPEQSETFVTSELAALERAGHPARVESARRAQRQDIQGARRHTVNYSEDDPPLRKLRALVWLTGRHPLRCARDLLARRRWGREEPVAPLRVIAPIVLRLQLGGEPRVHAQFAAGAALTAMRVSRLSGRPFSVTAHAYEIFRDPRNLREKLEQATFVTTGCAYNVAQLRQLAPAARVHEIVMGVDAERFVRRIPYPSGRSVIAVGRLVEKKGFAHLIDAVAILEALAPIERLEIVGDGPLREQLQARVSELGLGHRITLSGALNHEAVRAILEQADLLAMPCVVAQDGDRDSMPVVVKEAMALEIPVVGSEEVGLPELIEPEWGRLVPPAEPGALADAIAELLALDRDRRVQMGRAGRAHVLASCNVDLEAAKLIELMEPEPD